MKFFAVFAAFVAVAVASTDVSTWTLEELSDALQNPSTNPVLMPYLEHALNQYMDALFSGQQLDSIAVVTPAGLIPVEAAAPVVPTPVLVDSKPEVTAPAVSSPLVQIIVNIVSDQQSAAPVPAPAVNPTPVITPDPVSVVEIAPEPVSVAEIAPEPVSVVEIAPETVSVAEPAPTPVVDAVPISPVIPISVPEVNPIDILAPIIITPVIAGGDVVGPIV